MPVTLKKSPIVELVAELNWDILEQQFPGANIGNGPSGIVINQAECEEFFMMFSGEVNKLGFKKIERLFPHGMPLFSHQPIFRFRSENNDVLYQVGAGYFSVNATAGYKSWNDFSPVIEDGLNALLTARSGSDKLKPFSNVSLRYLDAFKEPLIQGMGIDKFMSEVLGINISIPTGISNHIAKGETHRPSLQLQIPMKDKEVMLISIGEGMSGGNPAFLMDTNVVTNIETNADVAEVMAVLNLSHNNIHNMFFEITKPIMALMEPSEVN
ncbi:TIGR04255 family protein [Undibacterium sp. Di27W]|uniref:TIGR04255 family protein n=1 Tax=Undibacterium sp. Di27W TaxID=3413036 RepID=UPI003BF2F331